MSYFADVMGEIVDDIAAIAEICGYHEEPDDMDAWDYYASLVYDAEDQGWAVRDAVTRMVAVARNRGLGWVDGQAEICRRIVSDMTGIGLLNEPDPILEHACEYHD